MQLKLILIIIIAIGVAGFALQNVEPVSVSLAIWHFDGSLSLVLLIVFGLGVLIAGLLSSPALIRNHWRVGRANRRITQLEGMIAERDERIAALNAIRSGPIVGSSAGGTNASDNPNNASVDQSHA
ncbi:MAG: LapA family protein [Accumulibacter sp.]|jgi:putative membrane protein|uniref:LapA family protein n=1 Tax=Accumulibacter sp. TaxID=2053492 RepID=UPI002FC3426A